MVVNAEPLYGYFRRTSSMEIATIAIDETTILRLKRRSHCRSDQAYQFKSSDENKAKRMCRKVCCAFTIVLLFNVAIAPFLFSRFRFGSSLPCNSRCATISVKIRRFDGKRATKTTSVGTQ